MAAQYGPHRWSAGYHDDGKNDAFRGARFMVADLAGAKFVDCDLSGVKIADSWLVDVSVSGYRTVLDEPMPYHRLGLPQTAYAPAAAAALGMDLGARPSLAEVMKVRADRMALVRGIVDDLTDAGLERPCTRAPAPGYPEEPRSVGECLGVVMEEECEHRRFALRDLAVLEAG
jgi:hypothetical protein